MNKKNLGSFRFLFADRTDLYFSRNLVKLDFQQYCCLKLREEGYKSVIFIDLNTQEESSIYCAAAETAELFKKNAFHQVFGLINWKNEDLPKTEVKDGKPFTWIMKNSDIQTVLTNMLLNDKEGNKRFAFVIDIDTLDAIFPGDAAESFEKMLKPVNLKDGSIFVITAPDNYTGSMPEIINYMFGRCKIESSVLSGNNAEEICRQFGRADVKADAWHPFAESQKLRMFKRLKLDGMIIADENRSRWLSQEIGNIIKSEENRPYFNRRQLYEEMSRRLKDN